MLMRFKQRMFSWFDSYDIYDANDEIIFTVKGEPSWGHLLNIYNYNNMYVGTVKERIFQFLPCFELYYGKDYLGCLRKKFTFFTPKYEIEYNGWRIEGDFFEWDYSIVDVYGNEVARISKELFRFTDTYTIDVADPNDAVMVLMFVVAMDAEKCSRD